MNVGASHVNDIKELKDNTNNLLTITNLLKTESVAIIGATTNLTAVPASFVALADVKNYLDIIVPQLEGRIDIIESKLDTLITALKTSNVIL